MVYIDTGTNPLTVSMEGAITYTSAWLNATFQAAGISTVCSEPGRMFKGSASVYFGGGNAENPDKRAFTGKGFVSGFSRCPHLVSALYPEVYIFKLGVWMCNRLLL